MIFEVYDIETLSNLFTYTGYDVNNKIWYQYVISPWKNDTNELVAHLKTPMIQVGFNNENFDYPVIHHILNHYKEYENMTGMEIAMDLYQKAQDLINSRNEDGRQFTTIADKNKFIPQIDLFKIAHYDNKARMTSLKDLEICMRMENVEEMPIAHNTWCTEKDEECVLSYNKNDVYATFLFLKTTLGKTDYPIYKGKNKLNLRQELIKKFNIPCMNYPDVKIGEQLMLKLYSDKTGISVYDLKKAGGTPRSEIHLKDCIPSWANFESPEFNKLKHQFEKSIIKNSKGEFSHSVKFHNTVIDYGTGGAHSSLTGIFEADNEWTILDEDVGSLYPSLAIQLGLYPEHLGPQFLEVYDKDIVSVRLAEKKKPKKERNMVIMEGYKLAANGIYGKSGEQTSPLYDPLYTMKTTIGGQMFLSLWSEKIVKASPDCKFLQHNTDGLTILVRRKDVEKIHAVNDEMTKLTGLYIEENIYKKMILRDVNNYIAVYDDYDPVTAPDHLKLKGCFEIDKEYHKDPSMRIVPIALKEFFVNNKSISETIIRHSDIFDFCLRLKTNSKSSAYFIHVDKGEIVKDSLARTTRYYIGKGLGSGSLYKDFGEGRESGVNVGYSAILFNKFENKDMSQYNIDYRFYISEAMKIKNAIDDGQLSLF